MVNGCAFMTWMQLIAYQLTQGLMQLKVSVGECQLLLAWHYIREYYKQKMQYGNSNSCK